ncbi:DUF3958 family protein [Listeria weihenstephanensis]|uniref:DUF3958 family protein n=1 Tax=Listeria weihenstephanensis TaxID=1006155 RepID=A0A841Z7S5_9LIST|nr:DUF3958 family protein [Listeria weihenstephanensis]MBC1501345.1 DUF3958 family protein [Listeria weihenstephanensis]
MEANIEKKMDALNLMLRQIEEKQDENREASNQLNRREQDWYDLSRTGSRVIDRVTERWREDRDIGWFLEDARLEFRQAEQRCTYELEEEKERLGKEKRVLMDQEDDCYYERRKLSLEGGSQ